MKTIKILGTGCARCKATITVVEEFISESDIEARVEKVEDIQDIMVYNVLSTPAIVVDEEVKMQGKVPSKDEVKALLQ